MNYVVINLRWRRIVPFLSSFAVAVTMIALFGCGAAAPPTDLTPPTHSVTAVRMSTTVDQELLLQLENPNNEIVMALVSITPGIDDLVYRIDGMEIGIDGGVPLDAQEQAVLSVSNLLNDEYTVVIRTADTNGNMRGTYIAVTSQIDTTPLPDLGEVVLSADSTTFMTGAEITLRTTLRNIGAIDAKNSIIRYYQSPDSEVTVSDTEIARAELPILAADASGEAAVNIVAPTVAGVYYYATCADRADGEENDSNNCSAPVAMYVVHSAGDLSVAMSVGSTSVVRGGQITIRTMMRNNGDIPSGVFHLSYDTVPTSPGGGGGGRTLRALILPSIAAGDRSEDTYTFIGDVTGGVVIRACVLINNDADNVNNCDELRLTISNVPIPDLTIQDPPDANILSVVQGSEFMLSSAVRNSGSAALATTATLRYYLSADSRISPSDTEVGDEPAIISALASGATSMHAARLTAPDATGIYYYGACVELVLAVGPTLPPICARLRTVAVVVARPDIAFSTGLRTSASDLAVNARFTLTAVLENVGQIETSATTIKWYRSDNAIISPSDALVGTQSVAALAAGASRTHRLDLTTPAIGGNYYYGACVASVTDEAAIGNNCSSVVGISVPFVDFVVPEFTTNVSTIRLGLEIALNATVMNDGTSRSDRTTIRYYLSTNRVITSDDRELHSAAVAPLDAGSMYRHSTRVIVPYTHGTFYYGACVDQSPGEPNSFDNCSAAARVTVTNPLLGTWRGRNMVTVTIVFLPNGRHTSHFSPGGISRDFNCAIAYRFDRYTVSACQGSKPYRGDVEGTHTYSLSEDNNTIRTSAGPGGTTFTRQ